MEQLKIIFETASSIIISFGGAGAIILGLSKWFGKLWANKIFEDEKAKHAKELEFFKSELQKESDRIKSKHDKALYVSKTQYDNEYRIYMEIWEALNNCVIFTMNLFPIYEEIPCDRDEKAEYEKEKYNDFVKAYNIYSMLIEKYAPFYTEKFYENFIDIKKICSKQGTLYKMEKIDKLYSQSYVMVRNNPMTLDTEEKVYNQNPEKIEKLKKDLQKEIKTYLLNLQLIN